MNKQYVPPSEIIKVCPELIGLVKEWILNLLRLDNIEGLCDSTICIYCTVFHQTLWLNIS